MDIDLAGGVAGRQRAQRGGGVQPRRAKGPPLADMAGELLEGYAQRGVFKGFSPGPEKAGKPTFKILWHADRVFELALDEPSASVRFSVLLPNVPASSAMYADLRRFVGKFIGDGLPDHRRIDTTKSRVAVNNRKGDVSLVLTCRDGDYAYGIRKLIHLIHEIYLIFLLNGLYYDYRVENLGLDIDAGGGL
jgi:hypothetical protein